MGDALAIATATTQFTEQTIKVVRLCKKIYDKVQDGPEELRAWRSELEQLQTLVEEIQRLPARGAPALGSHRTIIKSIQSCTSVSTELCAIFDRFDFHDSDPVGRKTWKAIGGLAKESDIRDLFTQLERLKSTLALQIQVVNSRENHQQSSQLNQVIEKADGIKNSTQTGTEEERCIRALFVTDPTSDRNAIITAKGKRTAGTCEWIISTEGYKTWENTPESSLLWIYGPPGKGKTFISIFLTQHLEAKAVSSGCTLIYFFCDNKASTRNTAVNILRGLMYQLIQRHGRLLPLLVEHWKVQQGGLFSESSFESLWSILQAMISALIDTPIYCVLDALDECSEASLKLLLYKLKELFNSDNKPTHKAKLAVLSRRYPECLYEALSTFNHVQLDEKAHDIELYIQGQVSALGVRKGIHNGDLLEHVRAVFRDRAEGTFLWVSFMVADLNRKSGWEIEASLHQLPHGLDAVYGRILSQIKPGDRVVITELLNWITLAQVPLSVAELCEALQIQGTELMNREELCKSYIEACGHLLQLTMMDDNRYLGLRRRQPSEDIESLPRVTVVGFVHQSAKDFMLSNSSRSGMTRCHVDGDQGHLAICRRLLQHLIQQVPSHELWEEYLPLESYAALYWPDHMRKLGKASTLVLIKENKEWFTKKSGIRENVLDYKRRFDLYGPGMPLLHLACYLGLYHVAEHVLDGKLILSRLQGQLAVGKTFESWGGIKLTPLHLASDEGHESVVSLLLDRGADPIKSTGGRLHEFQTPLDYAVRKGHMGVFLQLAKTKKGQGMIQYQVSQQDGNYNLLNMAASSGNQALCDELIEKYKFKVNATAESTWWTPLTMAIIRGNVDLARRLIQRYKASTDHHIMLLKAACRGFPLRSDIFTFLVEELQLNINAVDDNGNTWLHPEQVLGHLGPNLLLLLERLLTLSYDFRALNNAEEAPLHSIISVCDLHLGHPETPRLVIAFLIKRGQIDANAQDHEGGTALHLAAKKAWEHLYPTKVEMNKIWGITRALLDHGADRTLRDGLGRTARDYLMGRRFRTHDTKEMCEVLLDILRDYSTVPVDLT